MSEVSKEIVTLIINDDFPHLIQRLESDERIAGVSPLIRDNNARRTIQYAGYTPLSAITLRNRAIGEGETDAISYPAKATPFLHGAAMLFKRDAIEKSGKMPEIYFLYYEELDWCASMYRNGYTLWYDPACEIIGNINISEFHGFQFLTVFIGDARLIFHKINKRIFLIFFTLSIFY